MHNFFASARQPRTWGRLFTLVCIGSLAVACQAPKYGAHFQPTPGPQYRVAAAPAEAAPEAASPQAEVVAVAEASTEAAPAATATPLRKAIKESLTIRTDEAREAEARAAWENMSRAERRASLREIRKEMRSALKRGDLKEMLAPEAAQQNSGGIRQAILIAGIGLIVLVVGAAVGSTVGSIFYIVGSVLMVIGLIYLLLALLE